MIETLLTLGIPKPHMHDRDKGRERLSWSSSDFLAAVTVVEVERRKRGRSANGLLVTLRRDEKYRPGGDGPHLEVEQEQFFDDANDKAAAEALPYLNGLLASMGIYPQATAAGSR